MKLSSRGNEYDDDSEMLSDIGNSREQAIVMTATDEVNFAKITSSGRVETRTQAVG